MMLHHSTKAERIFFNLCCHQDYFGVKADWLLHMEMGLCDGVGGTVKQLISHVSLQRPHND